MSEPEMVLYKEVVEGFRKRVKTAILTLWKAHDGITISGTACEKALCKDCPALEVCREHLDKAIRHIRDAAVELGFLKHELGYILTELTGKEWIVEQEVRC